MLNKAILIGRLTRDPEIAYTTSGVAKLRFSLAIDRPYAGLEGERGVDFVDVVCWRTLAERCNKYLRKGLMTAVVGRIEVRHYEAEGQKRKVTEVIAEDVRFLEWPKDGSSGGSGADDWNQAKETDYDDGDLPFLDA